MTRVYLGLGSNLGDRLAWLRLAAEQLTATPGLKLSGGSSLYRTAPWGRVEQADFYNAVAAAETEIPLPRLLERCQQIEQAAGRQRRVRWGQRTLDIDILLAGEQRCDQPQLTVPHPYLQQRRFVLLPLAELMAALGDPQLEQVRQWLALCPDRQAAELIMKPQSWLR